MASRISRRPWRRGRPSALGAGRWSSKQPHSASERSVWYAVLMLGILPSEYLRTPFQTVSMRRSGKYDEGRASSHPSGGLFRVGAILVATRRAVQQGEHQQHYRSDQRHQPDQYPPTRAVDVVEPPYGHGQGRDDDRQAVDPAQQPCARRGAAGAKQGVDQPQHYAYDDVEEHEVPVLPAS